MSQVIHPSQFRYCDVNELSIGTRSFRMFSSSSQFLNLGVILAGYTYILKRRNGTHMRIVCSWCRREGRNGLVGEKAPLEDRRETHGICIAHRVAVQAGWRDAVRGSGMIGTQFIPVGAGSQRVAQETGRQVALSAAHLWIGLMNLTRKARF